MAGIDQADRGLAAGHRWCCHRVLSCGRAQAGGKPL